MLHLICPLNLLVPKFCDYLPTSNTIIPLYHNMFQSNSNLLTNSQSCYLVLIPPASNRTFHNDAYGRRSNRNQDNDMDQLTHQLASTWSPYSSPSPSQSRPNTEQFELKSTSTACQSLLTFPLSISIRPIPIFTAASRGAGSIRSKI